MYVQNYFKSPFFPNNMPGIWQQHFAFAQEATGRPIVIGEIGGTYVGADKIFQDWALPYIVEKGFGLFYFALNPDSKVSKAAFVACCTHARCSLDCD